MTAEHLRRQAAGIDADPLADDTPPWAAASAHAGAGAGASAGGWSDPPPPVAPTALEAETATDGESDEEIEASLPPDIRAALERGEGLTDDPEVSARSHAQILDVVEGMGAIFHEHQNDILGWPWKLFCAKWRRLIMQSSARRWEDDTRDFERARQREQQEDQERQRALFGGD